MANLKDPGINIEFIRLAKANIALVNTDGEKTFNLRLLALERKESEDGKQLDLAAVFDVMHGVEKPIFNFTCEFVVRYKRETDGGMAWKDFSSGMALAHIIPYLREFVSNMTDRLPIPPLMLPPVNAFKMVADDETLKADAGKEPPAAPVKA